MLPTDDLPLPRRVPKPWGYEIWYARTDRYAGKILHVDRGHRLSLQYHEQDESCYLLTGRLLLLRGPDVGQLTEQELTAGSVGVTSLARSTQSKRWRTPTFSRSQPPTSMTSCGCRTTTDARELPTPDIRDGIAEERNRRVRLRASTLCSAYVNHLPEP